MITSTKLKPLLTLNEREFSIHTFAVFLAIAEHDKEGIFQADLVKYVPISKQAISRNTCLLADRTHKGGEGMQLVSKEVNPYNKKMYVLHLTDKGRKLYEDLMG